MPVTCKLMVVTVVTAFLLSCGSATPAARENGSMNNSEVRAASASGDEANSLPGGPELRQLDEAEIRAVFAGKSISYEKPGTADAGVHEEFHEDGSWRGIRYSRGPISFSGRWYLDRSRLCVVVKSGYVAGALRHGPLCRSIWRDELSGEFTMEDAMTQGEAPLVLSLRSLGDFRSAPVQR
jgi:hypothetical protein